MVHLMDDKKISLIHTPCKNCVAAVYKNHTQTDCYFKQLDKFKENVLEVYDGEKEFFVIDKKKCMYYRESSWLNKKGIKIDHAMDEIKKENTIPYIAILNIDTIKNLTAFNEAVDRLVKQKTPPCGFVVMMQKKKNYDIQLEEIMQSLQETQIPWRIQSFIEEYDLYRYIKAIIQSAPRKRLYILINNRKIPKNFYETIMNYNFDNNPISAININNNIFFSFAAMAYTIQMLNKNLLEDKTIQCNYENIQ